MNVNYNDSIYMTLYDERGFLAGVSKKQTLSYPTYTACSFQVSMRWIRNTVDNLNRGLLSEKDRVPREIFALRLVEEMGITGNKSQMVPVRTLNTQRALEKYSDKYYLENHTNEDFEVTLMDYEANAKRGDCGLKISLNIGTKVAYLNGYTSALDLMEYVKLFHCSYESAEKIRKSLADFPEKNWINYIYFNMIDDVYDFVEENKSGFKGTMDGSFIMLK